MDPLEDMNVVKTLKRDLALFRLNCPVEALGCALLLLMRVGGYPGKSVVVLLGTCMGGPELHQLALVSCRCLMHSLPPVALQYLSVFTALSRNT